MEETEHHEIKGFDGVWLPGEVAFNKDLSPADKMVWWLVNMLDGKKNCWASNDYLADKLGLAEATVSRSISKLIIMEYIKQIKFDGHYRIIGIDNSYKEKYKQVLIDFNSKIKNRLYQKVKADYTKKSTNK